MHRQPVALLLLSIFLVFVVLHHERVVTAGSFDWATAALADSAMLPTDTTEATDAAEKKSGNGVARVLSAPFRALGRLFGGGRKDDQQAKARGEKDKPKFESTKVIRIKDARTPVETSPDPKATAAEGTFGVYLQRGRELVVSKDYEGAIAELSLAAALDPKSGEAKNLLGIAYEGKGLRDRALESFKAAVEMDKDNAEYLNNYGFLLFRNKDFQDATKYLKRAAKLSPKDARIWNNLGLAQCEREKFDDAFQSFTRAAGEFNAHVNVAAQLSAHGEAKAAIKHLELARALKPNSADVLTKLVSLYDMTGRTSDAEMARRSIVALKTFADANK